MKKILLSIVTLTFAIVLASCGNNTNDNSRKAQELSGAGATFPYGKDPKDSNIRIAPSYPELDELMEACKIFILCVKLVSVKKILGIL